MTTEQIPGIPKGWELVRIGPVNPGEYRLLEDMTVETWDMDRPSIGWAVILRKIEKPKQYRPFASAAEFKPHRDRWIRRITNGGAFKITDYCDFGYENDNGVVVTWKEYLDFGYAFDDDGSPFGVEVSE